jgi:hypothetical protein
VVGRTKFWKGEWSVGRVFRGDEGDKREGGEMEGLDVK